MIKVQNIYYMLAYAYQVLNTHSYENLAVEEFQYASDLFAAILAKGIANQLKRGLGREYISVFESLSSPVGKINVTESIKRQTMLRRKLVCDYDNYSENEYLNKVLKTTVILLIKTPEVKPKQKQLLRKLLFYFDNVDEIDPYSIKWNLIKYHRNNATYKMLINICYLVIEGMLLSEKEGKKRLAKFLDDQKMHRLYEKFVIEFYRKHYPKYNASSMHIDWNIDNEFTDFLPMMKTDITLKYQGKTVFKETSEREGMSDWEMIELATAFVQGLDYVSDDIGTGYDEYPKFPLETLYDQGGDCEDSSILLASLLRELGYGTVLVMTEDHMGVGVKASEPANFTYMNMDFYYIETTAPGWGIGELPEEINGVNITILPVN